MKKGFVKRLASLSVAAALAATMAPAALAEETPLGCIGRPEDVAGGAWFLASEEARFLTGQVLAPNGGLVI